MSPTTLDHVVGSVIKAHPEQAGGGRGLLPPEPWPFTLLSIWTTSETRSRQWLSNAETMPQALMKM